MLKLLDSNIRECQVATRTALLLIGRMMLETHGGKRLFGGALDGEECSSRRRVGLTEISNRPILSGSRSASDF